MEPRCLGGWGSTADRLSGTVSGGGRDVEPLEPGSPSPPMLLGRRGLLRFLFRTGNGRSPSVCRIPRLGSLALVRCLARSLARSLERASCAIVR